LVRHFLVTVNKYTQKSPNNQEQNQEISKIFQFFLRFFIILPFFRLSADRKMLF